MRQQALVRLGLDYDSVAPDAPALVYAHLTAWGRAGPLKDYPGYDVGAFWAYTGLQVRDGVHSIPNNATPRAALTRRPAPRRT